MTSRSEQWHEERRTYVGASEVATVLGLSPYQTPVELWAVKTGRAKPTPDNDAMRAGRLLETMVVDKIRAHVGESYNWLEQPTIALADSDLRATPDLIIFAAPHRYIGEAKTTGVRAYLHTPPMHWVVQVQAQMIGKGDNAIGLLGIMERGTLECVIHRIEPHAGIQKRILAEVAAFMECVRNDTPPPAKTVADVAIVHPKASGVEIDCGPDSAMAEWTNRRAVLAGKLSEVRKITKDTTEVFEKAIAEIDAKIAEHMGDASRMVTPAGVWTFEMAHVAGYVVEPRSKRALKFKAAKETQ